MAFELLFTPPHFFELKDIVFQCVLADPTEDTVRLDLGSSNHRFEDF
jgi:hypothetical protein